LTNKQGSGCKFVNSRLASEVENVSTVPRPSLLEMRTQKSPVESSYSMQDRYTIMLAECTVLCLNMLLCYLYYITLEIMLA